MVRVLVGVAAVAGCCGRPARADDKPADWSGYVTVGELVGEVTKAGDDGLSVKVRWEVPTGGRAPRSAPRSASGALDMLRRMQPTGTKSREADYDLQFADAGLVRWKTKPAKVDENGKRQPLSVKELDALRKPAGAPGYAAARDDLKAGQAVEVVLVRPKAVPLDKVTVDQLRVKYALILTPDPTTPTGPKDGDKKKADDKKDKKKG